MTTNPPTIELTACVSSQIESFGYHEASQTLAIKFPGKGVSPGSVYHYADVPADVFEAMKAAESVGKFFGSKIRGRYVYVKQPDPSTGIVFGLKLEQEPKYTTGTKDGRLVNRSTGKPIPDDEPVFVIRGQDIHALPLLHAYLSMVKEIDQAAAVGKRIVAFRDFANAHPERMKEPDDVSLASA
jgi:hypothetical protein